MKGPIELLFDIATKVAQLATSAGQQGTGAAYDPPAGGAGQIGFLSGILMTLKGALSGRAAVHDSTGAYTFYPEECAEVITYNGDGTIATDTLTDPVTGNQYRQTFSYTGGQLTAVTGWVKL